MLNRLAQFLKQNFFLVGTTAFPGLHKLLVLFVVNECNGLTLTADFINDIFVLYILGYITVFNWANFILSDMMKITKASQSVFFGKIYGLSLVTTIPLLIVLCFFISNDWIVNDFGFFVLLLFWSYHQLWRHFLIAKGWYQKLFIADSLLLIVTLALIVIASHFKGDLFLFMCIPLFVIPLMFHALFPVFTFHRFGKRIWSRALNYTLINLSTGGIQLIFAPLSHHLLAPSYTRIIGFTNNLASIALLIPRAMAYQFIPKLSAKVRVDRDGFFEMYQQFLKVNMKVVLSMFVIGLMIISYFQTTKAIMQWEMMILSVFVYANLLIGQLSVPSSNVLVVTSRSAHLLKVNVFTFLIMAVQFIWVMFSSMDGWLKILMLLSLNMTIGILRYLYLVKFLNRTR